MAITQKKINDLKDSIPLTISDLEGKVKKMDKDIADMETKRRDTIFKIRELKNKLSAIVELEK